MTVKCTTIEVSIIPNSIFPLISFPPVKKRFILLLICMRVCCLYVYMCMCPWKPKGTSDLLELEIQLLGCGYWELNLGPLQEQQMLLTVEPSFQLLPLCLNPPFIALETRGNLHPIPGICTVKDIGVSLSRIEPYRVTGAPEKIFAWLCI